MKKSFVIKTGRAKDILADVCFSDDGKKIPVVIFCHGYKGYKDWGAWNLVADTFAKEGFFFVKFNFSHNGGTLENPIDFPDLEAFGKNTYSLEVADLDAVIDWVVNNQEFDHLIDSQKIHIVGHSRGGGIVTLVANNNGRVGTVTSWAGVADYGERFPTGELLAKWKKEGVYYVVNGRTKQNMPHYFSFYEDYQNHKNDLDILKAASCLKIPHLIIHGDNDEAVNVTEANRLKKANPEGIVKIISGAGHTFGSSHPWGKDQLPAHLKEVVEKTINFIKDANPK